MLALTGNIWWIPHPKAELLDQLFEPKNASSIDFHLGIFQVSLIKGLFFRNDSVVLTRVFSHRSYICEKRIYQKFIPKIIFTRINFIAFIASLLPIEKMDIRGFLNRSNKKTNLSSGSKEEDEPKRQREESPDVS